MSYTTMHVVPEKGEIWSHKEYANAHRSANLWWQTLAEHYQPGEDVSVHRPSFPQGKLFVYGYDFMKQYLGGEGGMDPVWGLAKHPEVKFHHRLVMALTFDRMMVRFSRIYNLAHNLKLFVDDFGIYNTGHAREIAKDLLALHIRYFERNRKLPEEKRVAGVCFTWTSVSDDAWKVLPREGDELRYWDISRDEGHCWLFESEERWSEEAKAKAKEAADAGDK